MGNRRVIAALCWLMLMIYHQVGATAGEPADLCVKASALYTQGKIDEAFRTAGDALAQAEKKHGEGSLESAGPLMLLAEIHQGRRELPEAARCLERVRWIQEKNLGPRNTRVSGTISELIAVYEKLGERDKAESLNAIAYERWGKPRAAKAPAVAVEIPSQTTKDPSLKDIESYAKIMVTLADYRKKHTYSTEDFFVCADMVVDVWNILKTQGIRSRIAVGNVERDLRHGTTETEYIAGMNHAWLLAEVRPNEWIPLEATGGYIVDPASSGYSLYLSGITFENPKQFKAFSDLRISYFKTCREAKEVVGTYNNQFAGKTATQESLEYRGRALQKFEDCKRLATEVLAHLKH
ncbi:MAG: tetratricopeptide repeat protein [Deltaproteobacteria bacterium]|nr:tetratricopeptide repeat protein [Deltaproteobacteria bacterium]